MAKRVRYVCKECGAEKRYYAGRYGVLKRIDCPECREAKGMGLKQPSPANHYRPTRSKS